MISRDASTANTKFVIVLLSAASCAWAAGSASAGDAVVEKATCEVFCNAMASRSGTAGRPNSFIGGATAESCSGDLSYSWDFGDGGGSNDRDPIHTYAVAGDLEWTFTAAAEGSTCSQSGTISVSAGAEVAPVFVPAVAHAPGAGGTVWRTDLAIVNLAGVAVDVDLTFLPYGGGVESSGTVNLADGAIREWRDVLVTLFDLSAGASEKGTVRLESDVALFISARTYNQTAAGTFGQFIPAIGATDSLGAGDEGVVLLLRKTPEFRSNLGFLNVSTVDCTVKVDLRNHKGIELGPAQRWNVPPGRYWQRDDVFGAFGVAEAEVAYAVVMPETLGCSLWAYGSVVDNDSGDPTTIPVLSQMESAAALVAGVAHAPGADGTEWRTDLAVGNRSGDPVAATMTFVPYGGGTPVVRTKVVPEGVTNVWKDALVSLFGFPAGEARKGTLELTGDRPLFVTSRTYNETASGTFGQGMPALSASRCLAGGEVGVIPQLRKSSAFRSNLGILNTGVTRCTVAVRLHGEDGEQLGSTLLRSVAGGHYWQQDDIFSGVGVGGRELAYATVQLLTPESTVWAYGSVVDNATGDPTTVPMIVGGAGAIADHSGFYHVTIGPAPAFTLELIQVDTDVNFTLAGKDIDIVGTGTAVANGVELIGEFAGMGQMALHLTFTNHGQVFSGPWDFDSEVPLEGTVTGTRGPRPTWSIDGLGLPPVVESNGINLETIREVSRLRSGAGHDFSDDFEDCRSMKHYFAPKFDVDFEDITVYAPFDGTVIGTTEEWEDASTWKGTAIGIRSNEYPAFSMTYFHIDLHPPLLVGEAVMAGQTLGISAKASGTATDFALRVITPDGNRLVSYFLAMTDSAFSAFQARGAATRDLFVIPEAERDADPLQCVGQQFVDGGNLENWVILN